MTHPSLRPIFKAGPTVCLYAVYIKYKYIFYISNFMILVMCGLTNGGRVNKVTE